MEHQKKYKIIYADPPWRFKYFGKSDDRYRRAEGHYNVMDLSDIKKLPIGEIADKDCLLFLWVIDPMLPQGLELMKSWGFKFKTVAFTWVKKNKTNSDFFTGMGYWTRANPEMCLLGTMGNPKRINADVSQLVFSQRREHSRKPDEIRHHIIRLVGDLPRIELFARQKTEGWDCFGNEVDSDVQLIAKSKTQGATPSFNMRYQENSAEFSQMPNGTSDNANIIRHNQNEAK